MKPAIKATVFDRPVYRSGMRYKPLPDEVTLVKRGAAYTGDTLEDDLVFRAVLVGSGVSRLTDSNFDQFLTHISREYEMGVCVVDRQVTGGTHV